MLLNKKNLFLIAISLISNLSFYAQNFWQGIPNLTGTVKCYANNSVGDIFISGGCGLLRSTDDGESWIGVKPANVTLTNIAINSSDDLFACSWGDGIYRSTDNGLTWMQINNGLTNFHVFSICIHPNGDLYAGLWVNICRSTDNGNNWTSVNLPENNIVSLNVDNNGTIFAASNGNYVFRSTDNGNSWIHLYNGLTTSYIQVLSINSDQEIFVGTVANGAFRSTDGGNNWIQAGLTGKWVYCFAFMPGGEIFAGTDQGVFKTSDCGANWTSIDTTGLSNSFVYSLFFNSAGYLFAGTGIGLCRSAQPIITSMDELNTESSTSFLLSQNYPNPFNSSTKIQFVIPTSSLNSFTNGDVTLVTLKVYNVLGNEVATLVNEEKPAGNYEVEFSAIGGPESSIKHPASGIYFYQLKEGNFIETKKMILLR